jgi:hypothetical protein
MIYSYDLNLSLSRSLFPDLSLSPDSSLLFFPKVDNRPSHYAIYVGEMLLWVFPRLLKHSQYQGKPKDNHLVGPSQHKQNPHSYALPDAMMFFWPKRVTVTRDHVC